MKKIQIFFLFCTLSAAFIAGFFAFSFLADKKEKPAPEKQVPLTLNAELLKTRNAELTQNYIGYIIPIDEVDIKPFISGFIEKIFVQGGQNVKKGDVLLILQQDEYIAALKSAQAEIFKADATLQNAAIYFERMQNAQKSVSKTEIDNAKASYLSAKASFEEAKAKYAAAKVNYDYTFIRAPIDGIVGEVNLTRGNYISPSGSALFKIVKYNPVRVVFSISDKEYMQELEKPKPFADEKLFLKLPNGKTFFNEGTFRYTDNNIDKSTSSMAVYADFENTGKILTPNTYVTVLSKNTLKNVILAPKNLITLENNGNFVYLVRNGKLIKQEVEILATSGENFILKNTFEKGDAIVLDNVSEPDLGKSVEVHLKEQKA